MTASTLSRLNELASFRLAFGGSFNFLLFVLRSIAEVPAPTVQPQPDPLWNVLNVLSDQVCTDLPLHQGFSSLKNFCLPPPKALR